MCVCVCERYLIPVSWCLTVHVADIDLDAAVNVMRQLHDFLNIDYLVVDSCCGVVLSPFNAAKSTRHLNVTDVSRRSRCHRYSHVISRLLHCVCPTKPSWGGTPTLRGPTFINLFGAKMAVSATRWRLAISICLTAAILTGEYLHHTYRVAQKIGTTFLYALTLSNIIIE